MDIIKITEIMSENGWTACFSPNKKAVTFIRETSYGQLLNYKVSVENCLNELIKIFSAYKADTEAVEIMALMAMTNPKNNIYENLGKIQESCDTICQNTKETEKYIKETLEILEKIKEQEENNNPILLEIDDKGYYTRYVMSLSEIKQYFLEIFPFLPGKDLSEGISGTICPMVHFWAKSVPIGSELWNDFITNMSWGLPESDIENDNLAQLVIIKRSAFEEEVIKTKKLLLADSVEQALFERRGNGNETEETRKNATSDIYKALASFDACKIKELAEIMSEEIICMDEEDELLPIYQELLLKLLNIKRDCKSVEVTGL